MFSEVVGQKDVKKQIISQVGSGRVPHAILLSGPEGCGKLAFAVSLAQYLLCQHPKDYDACGVCPSCRMSLSFVHPDLHFVFPVVKGKSSDQPISDNFLEAWRRRLSNGFYFGLDDWMEDMNAEGSQPLIYSAESGVIQNKLALTPFFDGARVVVVWLAEKMNEECANKLLKIIEEPPARTYFLLVSNDTGRLLPTIVSRTQNISLRALSREEIAVRLRELEPGCPAEGIARSAEGNLTRAIRRMRENCNGEGNDFFDRFVQLMRECYRVDLKHLKEWSEDTASIGRENLKLFITYSLSLLRESFVYNFGHAELNYLTTEEERFVGGFSRFVNERNIVGMCKEMETAARDIEQNTNAKLVLFDLALQMIVLLKK